MSADQRTKLAMARAKVGGTIFESKIDETAGNGEMILFQCFPCISSQCRSFPLSPCEFLCPQFVVRPSKGHF
jgi:hypothetical protein